MGNKFDQDTPRNDVRAEEYQDVICFILLDVEELLFSITRIIFKNTTEVLTTKGLLFL